MDTCNMKKAKLFKNGQSQAVRLPKEFQCPGKEVFIKRVGNTILLIPIENLWRQWERSLDLFSDDFMQDRNQPETQERED